MATTNWLAGISGNWNNAGLWTAGVPNSGVDATISAGGTYTVTLSSAAAAANFTLNGANGTFLETAGGSLVTGGAFTVDAGTAILHGANSFGSITVNGGLIEADSGAATTNISGITFNGGEFLALASFTLPDEIQFHAGTDTIAAKHGKTLTLSGSWHASLGSEIQFGDAVNRGTVQFGGSGVAGGAYTINVAGGTLQAINVDLSQFALDATSINIAAAATVDANGNDLVLAGLGGAGTVTNSSATMHALRLTDTSIAAVTFAGAISGALNVEFNGGLFVNIGHDTYSGTTTIDESTTLQLGDGLTAGTLGAGPITANGTLLLMAPASLNFAIAISGNSTGALALNMPGRTVTINHANTYTGTTAVGPDTTLSISRADAISQGGASLVLRGGSLVATATMTLLNTFDFEPMGASQTVSLAATHGHTLTLSGDFGGEVGGVGGVTLRFGGGANDGTVVWTDAELVAPSGVAVDIAGGTYKQGNVGNSLLDVAAATTVEAGSTLDLAGFAATIANLQGTGAVKNTGGLAMLTLNGGDFGGVIGGRIMLDVAGPVTLTGADTFIGGTKIESGALLMFGAGGDHGSATGPIDDEGTLVVNRDNAITLTGPISGAGRLLQAGSGVTTINAVQSFTGGTTVAQGELAVTKAGAIGSGALAMTGGEFLATKTMTLGNAMTLTGDFALGAKHGTTLNAGAGGWTLDASTSAAVNFGDGTNDGTVVWHSLSHNIMLGSFTVEVHSGTLRAGDAFLDSLTGNDDMTTIDAGATLDIKSFDTAIEHLFGAGVLEGSGNAVVTVHGGNFSGAINGNIALDVVGDLILSGGGTFQDISLNTVTVELDYAATQDVTFVTAHNTLVLDDSVDFSGRLLSFGQGQTLDLADIDFADHPTLKYKALTGVLTVSDGTHTAHIALTGSFSASGFHAGGDGHGGTDIIFIA